MQDKIEKKITLKAPIARVWEALTDYRQFSTWFRVNLENPFIVGASTGGNITYEGYEHMRFIAHVKIIEPQTHFAFTWNPISEGGEEDKARETLVEFRLKPVPEGTELVISESGFASIPNRTLAEEAYRGNTEGWTIQAANIAAYVEA